MRWIAALCLVAGPALAERLPLQNDFDHCAIAMVNAGSTGDMQGQLRLELLIRKDGKIYGAFISAEKGIQNRKFERCLTHNVLLWVFPAPAIDYQRSYGPISILPPGADSTGASSRMSRTTGQTAPSVMLPELDRPPPPEPLNLEAARETLEVDEAATSAQYGLAQLAVRRYPEAIKLFRDALAKNADDPEALRGLAEALAESKGDLKEALHIAARLLQVAPDSVAGHEAMIKVCLAANDAKCAAEHWKPANKAPDFGPRSRLFAEQLYPAVKQAAEDLRTHAAAQQQQQQSAPPDPCAGAKSEDEQTLCVVKRCLDVGSADYAKELSRQNKVEYIAGEWRLKKVAQGKMLVTREIATKETPPQQHNAMWLVKVGEQLVMQPTNAEARQITLTHNACASRVTAGQ